LIAANDGILLRNHIPRILKKHFRQKPYYVDLLDLFNEVGLSLYYCKAGLVSFLSDHDIIYLYPGGIPNSIRTNDRFNYHT
jgi:hypothetical protein